MERVRLYHDVLWDNFEGIDEQSILKDLPDSLRAKVRYHMFYDMVQAVKVFPKDGEGADKGALDTVIKKLRMKLIPKGEYVINQGEIANEMYFIVKGQVQVVTDDGTVIAVLHKGASFGEMALIQKALLRNASVQALTHVSVAILTRNDF